MDAGCAGGAGHCRLAPGPPRPTRSRRGLAGHGEAGAHRRRPLATLAAVANGDRESDPRGAWPEPPEEWSDALAERSGGNPLFARQLALALREQSMPPTEYAPRSVQALSGKPFALRLPDSIQRAVVARVDRLPVDLQVVLKASSVIGTAFLLRAVATLLVFDNGGAHAVALRERLDRLVEFGMLAVERLDPDPRYRFDHALTQEAIYNLLSFENRRRLHAAIATFFESEPAAWQPGPATLGLHWSRAGRPERAQPNWEAAGTAALSAGACRIRGLNGRPMAAAGISFGLLLALILGSDTALVQSPSALAKG
jgi:hypothetical protein